MTRKSMLLIPVVEVCEVEGCDAPSTVVIVLHPLKNGTIGSMAAVCDEHITDAAPRVARQFQVMNDLVDDLTSDELDHRAIVKEQLA